MSPLRNDLIGAPDTQGLDLAGELAPEFEEGAEGRVRRRSGIVTAIDQGPDGNQRGQLRKRSDAVSRPAVCEDWGA